MVRLSIADFVANHCPDLDVTLLVEQVQLLVGGEGVGGLLCIFLKFQ